MKTSGLIFQGSSFFFFDDVLCTLPPCVYNLIWKRCIPFFDILHVRKSSIFRFFSDRHLRYLLIIWRSYYIILLSNGTKYTSTASSAYKCDFCGKSFTSMNSVNDFDINNFPHESHLKNWNVCDLWIFLMCPLKQPA